MKPASLMSDNDCCEIQRGEVVYHYKATITDTRISTGFISAVEQSSIAFIKQNPAQGFCTFSFRCDEPLATEIVQRMRDEFSDLFVLVENADSNDPIWIDQNPPAVVGTRIVRGLYVPPKAYACLPDTIKAAVDQYRKELQP